MGILLLRLTTVLMQAATGVLVWRRPDLEAPPSLWRRVAVRLLVRAAVTTMNLSGLVP